MTEAGIQYYSFVNVVPWKTGHVTMNDVDYVLLDSMVKGYDVIVTLGTLADRAVYHRYRHRGHISMPHPSARNRKFNDPTFETRAIEHLKEALKVVS